MRSLAPTIGPTFIKTRFFRCEMPGCFAFVLCFPVLEVGIAGFVPLLCALSFTEASFGSFSESGGGDFSLNLV